MSLLSHRFTRAAALLSLLGLVGCVSTDRHVYESTEMRPTTVQVIDTVQNQVVWSMDVPVGHQIIIDFHSLDEMAGVTASKDRAEVMTWKLRDVEGRKVERREPLESNRVELPDHRVALRVRYRDRARQEAPDFRLPSGQVEPTLETRGRTRQQQPAPPEAAVEQAPAQQPAPQQPDQQPMQPQEPMQPTQPQEPATFDFEFERDAPPAAPAEPADQPMDGATDQPQEPVQQQEPVEEPADEEMTDVELEMEEALGDVEEPVRPVTPGD